MGGFEDDDETYSKYKTGWMSHPFDTRFPHENQQPHCLRYYVDYHRCKKLKGDDYLNCNYFKRVFRSSCFQNDVKKWDEQRENGSFMYKI